MILKFNFTILMGTLLVSTFLQASMEEAHELFDEAKCMKCHTKSHFKDRKERVNSYKKLSKSVHSCAVNSSAGWFEEDEGMVTEYLNHEYYHYKTPPKEED